MPLQVMSAIYGKKVPEGPALCMALQAHSSAHRPYNLVLGIMGGYAICPALELR